MVERMVLTPLTPATITSRKALLGDIEEGERRGWFANREESVEDALTLSTRFVWNGVIYVITLSGTLKRMERQLQKAVKELRAAAHQLEQDDGT